MNTVTEILAIIQIALQALAAIPATSADSAIASALVTILQRALLAYQAATGQPLDVTKVPFEAPVPVPAAK